MGIGLMGKTIVIKILIEAVLVVVLWKVGFRSQRSVMSEKVNFITKTFCKWFRHKWIRSKSTSGNLARKCSRCGRFEIFIWTKMEYAYSADFKENLEMEKEEMCSIQLIRERIKNTMLSIIFFIPAIICLLLIRGDFTLDENSNGEKT